MKATPAGFLSGGGAGEVVMPRGQALAGYRVGVIYIEDVWYPLLPGNIVNATTFEFPVLHRPVRGLGIGKLFGEDSADVFDAVLQACLELQADGVWAISAACGFFGKYQARARERLRVPVALSSLVQIPWIRALIPQGKIAVLTADSASLDAELLHACGVASSDGLVVAGLQDAPQFSAILQGRGSFDNEAVRGEVVAKALEVCGEVGGDGVGAILLECSDMPPYAAAVQAATGKPVFDFTTLIRYLHSAVAHRPYPGFI
ncbi:MAG: aspartate/glutamate racemase family protein [Propionibacteriaceae bacterium]|jgi:hypothetical protein|nr:aspartate/glutamate racemase family protein [Propionibacteriaceae bacterium]